MIIKAITFGYLGYLGSNTLIYYHLGKFGALLEYSVGYLEHQTL